MDQPLLPGIEEADFVNGLWNLHDPYVYLDDPLNFSLFYSDENDYLYMLMRSAMADIEKNVKNMVDNLK